MRDRALFALLAFGLLSFDALADEEHPCAHEDLNASGQGCSADGKVISCNAATGTVVTDDCTLRSEFCMMGRDSVPVCAASCGEYEGVSYCVGQMMAICEEGSFIVADRCQSGSSCVESEGSVKCVFDCSAYTLDAEGYGCFENQVINCSPNTGVTVMDDCDEVDGICDATGELPICLTACGEREGALYCKGEHTIAVCVTGEELEEECPPGFTCVDSADGVACKIACAADVTEFCTGNYLVSCENGEGTAINCESLGQVCLDATDTSAAKCGVDCGEHADKFFCGPNGELSFCSDGELQSEACPAGFSCKETESDADCFYECGAQTGTFCVGDYLVTCNNGTSVDQVYCAADGNDCLDASVYGTAMCGTDCGDGEGLSYCEGNILTTCERGVVTKRPCNTGCFDDAHAGNAYCDEDIGGGGDGGGSPDSGSGGGGEGGGSPDSGSGGEGADSTVSDLDASSTRSDSGTGATGGGNSGGSNGSEEPSKVGSDATVPNGDYTINDNSDDGGCSTTTGHTNTLAWLFPLLCLLALRRRRA